MKIAKFKRLMFWRRRLALASPDDLHQTVKLLERQDRQNIQELTRIMHDHQLDTRGRRDLSGLLKELDYQLTINIML